MNPDLFRISEPLAELVVWRSIKPLEIKDSHLILAAFFIRSDTHRGKLLDHKGKKTTEVQSENRIPDANCSSIKTSHHIWSRGNLRAPSSVSQLYHRSGWSILLNMIWQNQDFHYRV